MDYVPITPQDKTLMLDKIGVGSFEELIRGIPSAIPRAKMVLPPPISEPELLEHLTGLAQMNTPIAPNACFLGAGATMHYIPSMVGYIFSRGEFLTAYTPYQPEASQGTLQAMYEFQSLLCDLTQMDVANASLYDGASALAEACVLAVRHTDRKKVVLSGSIHPEYRQTVQTYLRQSDIKICQLQTDQGLTDLGLAKKEIGPDTAVVAVQMPNAYGCLEPVEELGRLAHQAGALFVVVAEPISLGVLKPPGSYGADMVVGEGQPLGIPPAYGGPYLGLFACKQDLLRKVPGRIVGMTRDAHGRRGFVLTLQAREQHIRRAKATSNICTNEAMMALAATVYLGSLGKEGFKELAQQNLQNAHYAFEELTKISRVEPLFSKPFFNEFALRVPMDPEKLNAKLLDQGLLGGLPLSRWDPALKEGWLLCVTEVHRKADIDRLVKAVQEAIYG